jgi:hypothetical protein
MDDFTPAPGAALSGPRAVSCPPWCIESRHDALDPPGTVLHRSPPAIVPLYDEACELATATVRAAFWDKAPDWIGTDPADLERPHVEVTFADGSAPLYCTPGQARSFAAGLLRAADAAETESSYRAPMSPGTASQIAPASVPPLSA